MKRARVWLLLPAFLLGVAGLVLAEDHNDDMGVAGSPGVPSAWDQESINVMNGNVHLSIPLYSAKSGADFGYSAVLHYNSKVWDASDANFPSAPASRSLIAKSTVGLGWTLHMGRVYRLDYSNGASSETFYYFEASDGSRHRLFRGAKLQSGNCIDDTYWYAHDGSGIRARFTSPGVPGSSDYWQVWAQGGTQIVLSQEVTNSLTTPEQVNFKGWYATSIKSSINAPGGGPFHWVTITYNAALPHCPQNIADDRGHLVTLDCQPTTADGTAVPGGVIRSVTVPAPHGQTLTWQFDYVVEGISDPFTCPDGISPCVAKTGVAMLGQITALGVSPTHRFQFGYHVGSQETIFPPQAGSGPTFGELTAVLLPGGAHRDFTHGTYRIWRKDFPISFDFPTLRDQFAYFPIRGLISRRLQVDGRTWRWDYSRQDGGCSASSLASCGTNPVQCDVIGPYEPANPAIAASTMRYHYFATNVASETPSPLDGYTQTGEVYAGTPDPARKIRTTTFEMASSAPATVTCHIGSFYKAHYGDNVRVTGVRTSFDDDGKSPHDVRYVHQDQWRKTSPNTGKFLETWEYMANGSTLYRKTVSGPAPPTEPPEVPENLTQAWTRILRADDTPISENNATFDDQGRMVTSRLLYAPGAVPQNQSSNDLVTIYSYNDAVDGNPDRIETRIDAQASSYIEWLTYQWGGYVSRRQIQGNVWYALDQVLDENTGLPVEIRKPWRTGVSLSYDLLGRPVAIAPLPGSPDPPVGFTYGTGQVTMLAGPSGTPDQQIGKQSLFDGLGRLKEERILKFDDAFADQWVARKYVLDAGGIQTISEWAPVGAAAVPVTSVERFGSYAGVQAFDPLMRARRILKPDGSFILSDYQGLVETTRIQGIQGGTIAVPSSIESVSVRTGDVFGRMISASTCNQAGCQADQPLITQTYDEMDRPLTRATNGLQPRLTSYDPLGRIAWFSEPERGTVWFGSHVGNAVNPDGYNALGKVVRWQDAAGAVSNPPYHYMKAYDSAGRLTSVSKEEDSPGTGRYMISEMTYDLADHGDASLSYLGRIARATGFDEAEAQVEQTDYFYLGSGGRLSKRTTALALWDGVPGLSGTDIPFSMYYEYDALGQVSGMTYPTLGSAGAAADSTYLSFTRRHGFIQSIDSNRGAAIALSARYADSLGLKEWSTPANVKTVITPDNPIVSRIREMKVLGNDGSELWSSGLFSYDGAGEIKGIGSDAYRYDALGRLREAQVLGTSAGTYYTQVFTYDAFNNLTARSDALNGGSSVLTTFGIDSATNRILGTGSGTWSYRADGALSRDDSFDYGYDNAGRLMQINEKGTANEVGRYYYDAGGLRVFRRESHGKEVFSFRDSDGNVLSQFSRPAGTTLVPAWDRDFVYLAGDRVGMIEKPAPAGVAWKFSSSVTNGPNPGLTLEWHAVTGTGLHGYLVYRREQGASTFTPLYISSATTTTNASTTQYIDPGPGLTVGTTYVYKIVAVDLAGNQGAFSSERIITFGDTVPPGAPSNLQATAGNGNVTLSWDHAPASPDLEGYYIYRKTGGSFGSPLNQVPIAENYYYDLGVANGTTYTYMVKAADTADLRSGPSNEVTATPQGSGGGGGGNGGGGVNPHPRGRLYLPVGFGGNEPRIASQDLDGETGFAPAYEVTGMPGPSRILYLHSDHLGSLRLVTDLFGAAVSQHKHLPFGEEVSPTHTLDPFRFAGYERDAESGLDYVRARYYQSGSGRWLSADPLGGGYEYVENSPLNFLDSTGLFTDPLECAQVCITFQDGGRQCAWDCRMSMGYAPPPPPHDEGPGQGPGLGPGPVPTPTPDPDPEPEPAPDEPCVSAADAAPWNIEPLENYAATNAERAGRGKYLMYLAGIGVFFIPGVGEAEAATMATYFIAGGFTFDMAEAGWGAVQTAAHPTIPNGMSTLEDMAGFGMGGLAPSLNPAKVGDDLLLDSVLDLMGAGAQAAITTPAPPPLPCP